MLKEIDINSLNENPFKLFYEKWMLISAGDQNSHNMMTASWGGLGVLWERKIGIAFVRPTRYTYEFLENSTHFAFNFIHNRKIHSICGKQSGREIDKTKATGLTPIFNHNTVYFEQAELILVMKKIYTDFLDNKNFVYPDVENFYPQKDYHKIFFGEIIKAYKQV